MITYDKRQLDNGLTVIVNRDRASRMAAVNLLYKVGARNESAHRTGLAHLFEHLMFRGTHEVPDFDTPVQMACGDNNAFTNNDYTDFYITLPVGNIETALWLESDRMTGLDLSQEAIEVEKRVVIEEFRQRYLNQPYGDQNMLLRDMVYKSHPYRWATIGLSPEHIEKASAEEIRDFYRRFYHPSNAILSISADIEPERVFYLAEKWFAPIEDRPYAIPAIEPEPEQQQARRLEVERDVPATTITIAFQMGDRLSRDFFLGDMTSDLLAGGDSARLYERLIKRKRLFASTNAYISGDVDRGMFVFTGQLLPSTTEAEAEAAIWEEIDDLRACNITEYEVEKVKNKFEANTLFGELNVMNKAMNLGYYEMIGDLELINREVEIYRSQQAADVADFSKRTFRKENSSTLIYRAK
ncbi:MAG: insulinase family protein [Alistipes sp.]|nr:insulinase family protein [Alistipes sp.]MBP3473618.1 insulinase family protein [Alistipes sp.]MBQ4540367.1 insulinase family protein [Alistipes sp.]